MRSARWMLVLATGALAVGCGDDAEDGGSSSSGGSSQGGAGTGASGGQGNTGATGAQGTGAQGGNPGGGDPGGSGGTGGAPDPCGNGVIDVGEECDGTAVDGALCILMGFSGGTVGCAPDCSALDLSACYSVEQCNDGIDDDFDGLYDCADPDCNNAVVCTSGSEANCTNIADDDGDILFDCNDPTLCQSLPICQAGAGAVGTPCVAPNDCDANMDDPLCISEAETGWTDGYCSEFCDEIADDCPVGSVCVSGGICVDECAVNADCRPLYACLDSGGDDVCFHNPNEICDDLLDNNNDGRTDCNDPRCAGFPGCDEVVCTGLQDDDGDGLFDCADPGCQALPDCIPGNGATGVPCTLPSECAANNNDPVCLPPELVFPFVDGYCSEFCDEVAQDCAAGSVCVNLNPSLCFESCAVDTDCREKYTCQALGPNNDLICFPSGNTEICDNAIDDDNDGDIDCDDLDCLYDPVCPEANCVDFADGDNDGLIDCADPDCQALAACAPGNATPGSPCATNSTCAANMNDPFCIPDGFGFPGGYCAEWCDPVAQDCAGDSVCVDTIGGVCFDGCVVAADCQPGYTCTPVTGGQTVCAPV